MDNLSPPCQSQADLELKQRSKRPTHHQGQGLRRNRRDQGGPNLTAKVSAATDAIKEDQISRPRSPPQPTRSRRTKSHGQGLRRNRRDQGGPNLTAKVSAATDAIKEDQISRPRSPPQPTRSRRTKSHGQGLRRNRRDQGGPNLRNSTSKSTPSGSQRQADLNAKRISADLNAKRISTPSGSQRQADLTDQISRTVHPRSPPQPTRSGRTKSTKDPLATAAETSSFCPCLER